MYMVKYNNPDCPVPLLSYWNRRANDGKID